jgi:formamidopyrimidine-DNA glycosylase
MPELPEVETHVRELAPLLVGRQVISAQVTWPRTIAAPDAATFQQEIIGQRFATFSRRGKYMLLGLASGATFIVHLRMTGHLRVQPANLPPDKHTHVVLGLDDGAMLHYQDARKFGRLWLVADPAQVLAKLGPEPLSDDFTGAQLAARLAQRATAIKTLLLDQTVVAGVGNIYADEALFQARIHPRRAGSSLQIAEIEALHKAIQQVLTAAIAHHGSSLGASSVQNYQRPSGESGTFQDEHQVYQRADQPCHRCGTSIVRIVLAQRSSHFCPSCQPQGA